MQFNGLKAHKNVQNEKSTLLTCPCYKIYRVEAVDLKKFQMYLKNYDFRENVKLRTIL